MSPFFVLYILYFTTKYVEKAKQNAAPIIIRNNRCFTWVITPNNRINEKTNKATRINFSSIFKILIQYLGPVLMAIYSHRNIKSIDYGSDTRPPGFTIG